MFVAFKLFFPVYVFQRRRLFDKVDEREGQDDAWRVKLRKKTIREKCWEDYFPTKK